MTKDKCEKLARLNGCEFVQISQIGGLEFECAAPIGHKLVGHDLHALVYCQEIGVESARMFYQRCHDDMQDMLSGIEPCFCDECKK